MPFRLEFTLFFGACLCFDSVLFVRKFEILPTHPKLRFEIITLPLTLFVHLIRFRFKEFTFDSIRFVAYCVVPCLKMCCQLKTMFWNSDVNSSKNAEPNREPKSFLINSLYFQKLANRTLDRTEKSENEPNR